MHRPTVVVTRASVVGGAFLTLLLLAGPAQARQPRNAGERRARKLRLLPERTEASEPEASVKSDFAQPPSGRFKLDLVMGPSIAVKKASDGQGAQFRLEPHISYDLTPELAHHIYLDFYPSFGFGSDYTTIALMPGVEADISLVDGLPLYVCPMFHLGVGFFKPSSIDGWLKAFGFHVGVAAKYVLFGRGNFFLEPVSLEFYPVQSSIDTDFGTYEADSQIFYNVMFAGGVNF